MKPNVAVRLNANDTIFDLINQIGDRHNHHYCYKYTDGPNNRHGHVPRVAHSIPY